MKKQVITHEVAGIPTVTENVAAGYGLGQWWRNTSTGKKYFHKTDGVWVDVESAGGGGDMTTTTAQAVSGLKTFLNGMFGFRNVADTFTSLFTNASTAARTYIFPDKDGTVAMLSDIPVAQITITTSVSITNATNDAGGIAQDGKNVIIDNGVNVINYTINGALTASFMKKGTGAITFVQGSGRTLVQVDGTAVFNGAVGSTATITSVGTTDYLRVSNA